MLDFSLEQIIEALAKRLRGKVDAAWLFGSVSGGSAGAWSDLDVVLVARSARPFIERPLDFPDVFELGLPVDLLVYTPEEFAGLVDSQGGFWKTFRVSRVQIV
ncbi:MAG TPA: nucleotidyltransferase domain-containing protein [Gammaproteobacteria bacterium]